MLLTPPSTSQRHYESTSQRGRQPRQESPSPSPSPTKGKGRASDSASTSRSQWQIIQDDPVRVQCCLCCMCAEDLMPCLFSSFSILLYALLLCTSGRLNPSTCVGVLGKSFPRTRGCATHGCGAYRISDLVADRSSSGGGETVWKSRYSPRPPLRRHRRTAGCFIGGVA